MRDETFLSKLEEREHKVLTHIGVASRGGRSFIGYIICLEFLI